MKTLIFEGDIKKIATTLVLSKFSKRAFNLNCSPIRFKTYEDAPLPKDNWIKVRNIQTGICGSDMTFYTCAQSMSMAMYPIPCSDITFLGHESVGVVSEIGKNVKNIKVGDRVVLKEYMQCCDIKGYDPEDFCENCKNGEYTICSNYGEDSKVTIPTGAGFGDYYIGPETKVIKIDDNITDDQAVIIEPCAVSLHSVMKKIPEVNDKVLVIGGGMIGLNIIQCIKLFQPNCEVHVMERVKEKQEFAKRLGADFIVDCDPYEYVAKHTNAKLYKKGKYKMLLGGFDIIYDTVGKHGIFNDAIRWIKARGTYVKVGYQMTNVTFDETPIWWQEINIIGVDSYGMETYEGERIQSFDLVVKLLNEGKLNFDGFITHRFKLSEYKKGFSQCLRKPHETIKVVLENDLDVFKK